MFDSRGLPDYPPAQNAWQFPPPPVSPRWKWAAIAAMVFALIGGTTMLAVTIAVGSSGAPGLIDNTRLISVIERECNMMTTTVERLTIEAPPRIQALLIADQNDAIDDMVAAIRDLGPEVIAEDPPTEEWLEDWGRLIEAREDYADAIRDGSSATLKLPTDDRGREIYVRMGDAFIDGATCRVPDVLVHPEPGDASDA